MKLRRTKIVPFLGHPVNGNKSRDGEREREREREIAVGHYLADIIIRTSSSAATRTGLRSASKKEHWINDVGRCEW